MARYVPKKGDFVALSFDPQSGHEQKGRRPALVVSNDLFNQHTGLAIVCPITNTDRDIPFHVKIPKETSLTGFVMVDQVKSIDYVTRNVKLIESAPLQLINEVLAVLNVCLY
ncbi:PemK-like protein [Beggiatoa sp. PS]|nr:PemK-like protein [Beggiatoa sp. PS]